MHDSKKLVLVDGFNFSLSFFFVVAIIVVSLFQGDYRNAVFSGLTLLWMALYKLETRRLVKLYKEKVSIEFKLDKRGLTKAKVVEMQDQVEKILIEIVNEYKSKMEKEAKARR